MDAQTISRRYIAAQTDTPYRPIRLVRSPSSLFAAEQIRRALRDDDERDDTERWEAAQTVAFVIVTCVAAWWAIFSLVGWVAKLRGFQ